MRWHRGHIPLFIHQHVKDKTTHKSNEGKVCWASYSKSGNGYKIGNSYSPEKFPYYLLLGQYLKSSKQLELLQTCLEEFGSSQNLLEHDKKYIEKVLWTDLGLICCRLKSENDGKKWCTISSIYKFKVLQQHYTSRWDTFEHSNCFLFTQT